MILNLKCVHKSCSEKKAFKNNKLIPSYQDHIGNWGTFSINITDYKYSDQLSQLLRK